MEITYKDLEDKLNVYYSLVGTPEQLATATTTKLAYAIQKNAKLSKPIFTELQEKIQDLRLDNAAEYTPDSKKPEEKLIRKTEYKDKEGNAQFRYEYTKEGEKALSNAMKELVNTKIDFEPYVYSDEEVISRFDEFLVEDLRGVFFPLKTT